MSQAREYPLYGDGVKGVVLASARFLDDSKEKRVRLDTGEEFMVPSDALEPQPDGSFLLRQRRREQQPVRGAAPKVDPLAPAAERGDPPPAPKPAEVSAPPRQAQPPASQQAQAPAPQQAQAPAPQVETAPPVEQLFRHGYNVRRVQVERILDEPVQPRQEGDTIVYPVMEEVVVFQKKLMLREEIYVTPESAPIEPRRIDLDAQGAKVR